MGIRNAFVRSLSIRNPNTDWLCKCLQSGDEKKQESRINSKDKQKQVEQDTRTASLNRKSDARGEERAQEGGKRVREQNWIPLKLF